jgi:hypothetical protein
VSFQARSKVLVRLVFLGLLIVTLFASFHPFRELPTEIEKVIQSRRDYPKSRERWA